MRHRATDALILLIATILLAACIAFALLRS
jgi:archaellum component FlaG (FlaF/FlaG flagellin family)